MSHRTRVASFCSTVMAALAVLGCSDARRDATGDGLPAFRGPWARLAFPNAGAAPTRMDLVLAFENLRFDRPVFLTHAGDGSDRLFVVEQPGRIRVFPNDPAVTTAAVFLDITHLVRPNFGGEEGLLGLAFDPQYAQNGHLYVHYTAGQPRRSVLARFTRDPGDADRADPLTHRILLEVAQPFENHNGGMLAFGPDDLLYASFGDGGAGGDPFGNAQDLTTLLGTVLRIDPNAGSPYGVPPDNPFVGTGNGVREEIWAYGLRHPWRFSFDRQTGELWLGDVGQGAREEIDLVTRGSNHGWNRYEGTLPFDNPSNLPPSAFTQPVLDYGRGDGSCVIGGYVYRGTRLPELRGAYLYADTGSGKVWALIADAGVAVSNTEVAVLGGISSFGEDRDGEVHVLQHGTGTVWTFERPAGSGGGTFPTLLSETGLFRDVARLVAADGVLEYDVQSPLWSDGAAKRRWIVLPQIARIGFAADEPWAFPRGTVLAKHFELETVEGDPSSVRRLETRVLIHEEGGWAGYTYRWNAAGTDAELLPDRATETLTVTDRQGVERTFDWTYPSRTDCLQCHTAAAGRVLGVTTRQLNHLERIAGADRNQLDVWRGIGMFTTDIGAAAPYPSMADPADLAASISDRARSWIDANCAMCHRPGGTTTTDLDLRHATPDALTNLVDVLPQRGDLGLFDARRVAPGAKERSVLWERLRRTDGTRMPPIGSVVPDGAAIGLVGAWIDTLR